MLSCSASTVFEWEGHPFLEAHEETPAWQQEVTSRKATAQSLGMYFYVCLCPSMLLVQQYRALSPRGQTGIAIAGLFQTGGRSWSSGQIARRVSISCAASDSSMAAAVAATATAFRGWASRPGAEVCRRPAWKASLQSTQQDGADPQGIGFDIQYHTKRALGCCREHWRRERGKASCRYYVAQGWERKRGGPKQRGESSSRRGPEKRFPVWFVVLNHFVAAVSMVA